MCKIYYIYKNFGEANYVHNSREINKLNVYISHCISRNLHFIKPFHVRFLLFVSNTSVLKIIIVAIQIAKKTLPNIKEYDNNYFVSAKCYGMLRVLLNAVFQQYT